MIVSVASIAKLSGGVQKFSLSEDWLSLPNRDESLAFSAPIQATGEVVNQSDGKWVVRGEINTMLSAQCDYCLKPVSLLLRFPFEESFMHEAQDDDESDAYSFTGDALDLNQMVQDNVLLNVPMRIVCSESCLGLCPVCGADRNITQCSCRKEAVEKHPMAALKAYLNDSEEV